MIGLPSPCRTFVSPRFLFRCVTGGIAGTTNLRTDQTAHPTVPTVAQLSPTRGGGVKEKTLWRA
jgi:hypothetical protein